MIKLVDLSVTISNKVQSKSKPKIAYWNHEQWTKIRVQSLGLKFTDFREGLFCSMEEVTLQTHQGTHLDAPWHYYPTSEGKPSKTIDQIPLEWCYGDGVVLDFSHNKRGEGISTNDLKKALEKIGYQLKPFDIVLIRTDATKHFGELDWENLGIGMTAESTRWLIEQGIKVIGIDSWTIDKPFDSVIKSGKMHEFFECHYLGKELEYCHLETLVNLDKIPVPFGFKIAVFPIKIEGASGGWVRAVAIVDSL